MSILNEAPYLYHYLSISIIHWCLFYCLCVYTFLNESNTLSDQSIVMSPRVLLFHKGHVLLSFIMLVYIACKLSQMIS